MAESTLAVTFVPRGEGLSTDDVNPLALASGRAAPAEGAAHARAIVDCGCAFPGHQVAIVDDAGRVLADRQVGQIVVSGPSVALGYFEQPELTASTFKPVAGTGDAPWLHTGDLGYLSGARLFVCGRVKDVIIVRGRNYYPSDIEWAVGDLAHVRRGNVVAFGVHATEEGVVHDGGGEEQLVVCCEGSSADAEAIREAATTRVAERFGLTVREVLVVPLASLPRTSSGKPQRNATRRMYIEGTLRLPRATTRSSEGASQIESEA
jgi:fatty-acyl-CoA synthase